MTNLLFTKSPSNPKIQKVSSVVVCRDEGCDEAGIDAVLGADAGLGTQEMTQIARSKAQSKIQAKA